MAASGSRRLKALRIREVCELTGLSRTTLWRLERDGAFPVRVQLSPNSVGWLAQEVADWLAKRPRGRSVLRRTFGARAHHFR